VQYRQQALAKVQAADELGNPLRLTTPRTWLAVIVLLLIVTAGGAWAATGSLPRRLTAPGILTRPHGAHALYSKAAGQITEVFVQPGQAVGAGAPVASLTGDATPTVVRTVAPGQVAEVLIAVGQFVSTGDVLARVDTVEPGDDRLVAVLYVPAEGGASIRAGADVDLAVRTAPGAAAGTAPGRFRGTVASVGEPETKAQISQFLGGDGDLADRFAGQGSAITVVVDVTGRPPYRLSSRTLVAGTVHLPDIRPVDWLLPRPR
jgi:Biotin-requiring enzyme